MSVLYFFFICCSKKLCFITKIWYKRKLKYHAISFNLLEVFRETQYGPPPVSTPWLSSLPLLSISALPPLLIRVWFCISYYISVIISHQAGRNSCIRRSCTKHFSLSQTVIHYGCHSWDLIKVSACGEWNGLSNVVEDAYLSVKLSNIVKVKRS